MKAIKEYKDGCVMVTIEEDGATASIRFRNEQLMGRLGECLTDLYRTGGNYVEIKPRL